MCLPRPSSRSRTSTSRSAGSTPTESPRSLSSFDSIKYFNLLTIKFNSTFFFLEMKKRQGIVTFFLPLTNYLTSWSCQHDRDVLSFFNNWFPRFIAPRFVWLIAVSLTATSSRPSLRKTPLEMLTRRRPPKLSLEPSSTSPSLSVFLLIFSFLFKIKNEI